MSQTDLETVFSEKATELGVPGAAIGVYHEGVETYAYHGVTSTENPLEVNAGTLFQFGSTGKTFTATAILRLVDQGKIDLDAPVRRYVPELRLKDASVAERVTVRQLLNHTAGWAGDFEKDTGTGDDALAEYVAGMADIEQVTPLGSDVSYNNASFSLAGYVIEKVTGQTLEDAMQALILDPVGLADTWFFPNDIMTRRFAIGHMNRADGTIDVARPWALPRSGNAAGGMSATAADQIAWARFHLANGKTADGTQLIPAELVASVRTPTVEIPGHALGDAIGLSWMLQQVGEVMTVKHGGTTIGQHSAFLLVPERDFAITILTNCGPNGEQLNTELVDWALENYAGVVEPEPDFRSVSDAELAEYVGYYDDTVAMSADIRPADGQLAVSIHMRPELLEAVGDIDRYDTPIPLRLLAGDGDRYAVPDGAMKGMRGYFEREGDQIIAVQLGGRRFALVHANSQ